MWYMFLRSRRSRSEFWLGRRHRRRSQLRNWIQFVSFDSFSHGGGGAIYSRSQNWKETENTSFIEAVILKLLFYQPERIVPMKGRNTEIEMIQTWHSLLSFIYKLFEMQRRRHWQSGFLSRMKWRWKLSFLPETRRRKRGRVKGGTNKSNEARERLTLTLTRYVIQSNPLNGSPDEGSIRLLTHVLANSISALS